MADAVLNATRREAREALRRETVEEIVQSLNEIASKHDYEVPPMSVGEFVRGDYLDGWTLEDEWGMEEGYDLDEYA